MTSPARVLTLLALTASFLALASSGGITGYSGRPGGPTCTNCHGVSANAFSGGQVKFQFTLTAAER